MTKIAKDLGINRKTVHDRIEEASEILVNKAQADLMADVFPLVNELWRESLKAQIIKAKKGEDVDFRLVDRLLKGMHILDRPISSAPEVGVPQPEGFETLTGFIASRPAPKRIGEGPEPAKALPTIDVEAIPQEPDDAAK